MLEDPLKTPQALRGKLLCGKVLKEKKEHSKRYRMQPNTNLVATRETHRSPHGQRGREGGKKRALQGRGGQKRGKKKTATPQAGVVTQKKRGC